MSDNIYRQNVYSKAVEMWHSKGRVGMENESAMQVYGQMFPVSFEQRPFSVTLNGVAVVSDEIAIVRVGEKEESIVGHTKGRYDLTQPAEYCALFDESVSRPVETLGFIGSDAARMFITWELPAIDVHGDKVLNYGFLAVGFDGKYGEHLYNTGVRVVCQNTWNLAVSDSMNAKDGVRGQVYSGKHNQKTHERDLSAWMRYITTQAEEYVAIHESLFCKMQETPVKKDLAATLFAKVYPLKDNLGAFYPDDIREEKQTPIDTYNQKQTESRDLAMELFAGAGIEIDSTLWGVYNAVTEAENHHKASKKDFAYSILMGNRAGIIENAMAVCADQLQASTPKKARGK